MIKRDGLIPMIHDGSDQERERTQAPAYDERGISLYFNVPSPDPRGGAGDLPILRKGNFAELKAVEGDNRGLQEYIRAEFGDRQVPMYGVDTHNLAFFGWCEALKEGQIEPGSVLLHYDDHDDCRMVEGRMSQFYDGNLSPTLEELKNMDVASKFAAALRIDQFIAPAVEAGLISEVIWVYPVQQMGFSYGDQEAEGGRSIAYRSMTIDDPRIDQLMMEKGPRRTIVDVDLDYFKPYVGDGERIKKKLGISNLNEAIAHRINRIRSAMEKAGVITMATSPNYISQTKAVELAKRLAA